MLASHSGRKTQQSDVNLHAKPAYTASIWACTVFGKKMGQKIFLMGRFDQKEEIFVSHLFAEHRRSPLVLPLAVRFSASCLRQGVFL